MTKASASPKPARGPVSGDTKPIFSVAVPPDPLELDEIVLHITSQGAVDREALTTELANLLHSQFEFRPNKILFHSAEEMRTLQQVGVALKEQKVVDNRPKVAPSRPDTHQESKP